MVRQTFIDPRLDFIFWNLTVVFRAIFIIELRSFLICCSTNCKETLYGRSKTRRSDFNGETQWFFLWKLKLKTTITLTITTLLIRIIPLKSVLAFKLKFNHSALTLYSSPWTAAVWQPGRAFNNLRGLNQKHNNAFPINPLHFGAVTDVNVLPPSFWVRVSRSYTNYDNISRTYVAQKRTSHAIAKYEVVHILHTNCSS